MSKIDHTLAKHLGAQVGESQLDNRQPFRKQPPWNGNARQSFPLVKLRSRLDF